MDGGLPEGPVVGPRLLRSLTRWQQAAQRIQTRVQGVRGERQQLPAVRVV